MNLVIYNIYLVIVIAKNQQKLEDIFKINFVKKIKMIMNMVMSNFINFGVTLNRAEFVNV